MTAVEWLEDNIHSDTTYNEINVLIEKAKEMEHQQIIDFAYWITDSKNIKTKDASIEELLETYKKV